MSAAGILQAVISNLFIFIFVIISPGSLGEPVGVSTGNRFLGLPPTIPVEKVRIPIDKAWLGKKPSQGPVTRLVEKKRAVDSGSTQVQHWVDPGSISGRP